jgi:hypothetical protein
MVEALPILIDQIPFIESLNSRSICLRSEVTQRAHRNQKGRQALLAIDNRECCNAGRRNLGGWGEHGAADEVVACINVEVALFVWCNQVVLLKYIVPELTELRRLPAVLSLIKRDLELLFPLDELLECALAYLHFSIVLYEAVPCQLGPPQQSGGLV